MSRLRTVYYDVQHKRFVVRGQDIAPRRGKELVLADDEYSKKEVKGLSHEEAKLRGNEVTFDFDSFSSEIQGEVSDKAKLPEASGFREGMLYKVKHLKGDRLYRATLFEDKMKWEAFFVGGENNNLKVNDLSASDKTVWSSKKVESELNKKADNSHDHRYAALRKAFNIDATIVGETVIFTPKKDVLIMHCSIVGALVENISADPELSILDSVGDFHPQAVMEIDQDTAVHLGPFNRILKAKESLKLSIDVAATADWAKLAVAIIYSELS